jgi:hypothetical protein
MRLKMSNGRQMDSNRDECSREMIRFAEVTTALFNLAPRLQLAAPEPLDYPSAALRA